jgi:hypothetical protein
VILTLIVIDHRPSVADRSTATCAADAASHSQSTDVDAQPLRAPERLNTLFALPFGMAFRARRGCAPTGGGLRVNSRSSLRGENSFG